MDPFLPMSSRAVGRAPGFLRFRVDPCVTPYRQDVIAVRDGMPTEPFGTRFHSDGTQYHGRGQETPDTGSGSGSGSTRATVTVTVTVTVTGEDGWS
ncbi:hypothetical protein SBD_0270 [Streptomyces bottropensis ATCC 25435]|uniref:Uncharacterized protein n=1 Tax=Streptomyces bottropensis ATCC 25435 TaxID=1054862 RepID=M3F7H6_9ACTN|nr:hypothetical protein SBD_0270 [Streptomyces bottropensis ATCC 25435]